MAALSTNTPLEMWQYQDPLFHHIASVVSSFNYAENFTVDETFTVVEYRSIEWVVELVDALAKLNIPQQGETYQVFSRENNYYIFIQKVDILRITDLIDQVNFPVFTTLARHVVTTLFSQRPPPPSNPVDDVDEITPQLNHIKLGGGSALVPQVAGRDTLAPQATHIEVGGGSDLVPQVADRDTLAPQATYIEVDSRDALAPLGGVMEVEKTDGITKQFKDLPDPFAQPR